MNVKEWRIPPEADHLRADVFLTKYCPGLTEPAIRDIFLRRDVKLDGVRIDGKTRVRSGQVLRVYFDQPMDRDPLIVVYEDEDVLLVNKPAGISVAPDRKGGLSLTELCAAHVSKNGAAGFEPVPCHRLDNPTSGLCLFAKNARAQEILMDVFRFRSLDKQYECLVRGIPKPPAAVCTAYLIKDAERAVVQVQDHPSRDARKIITGYETLSPGPVSRLRVHLYTGRTHQIRAHLAALGHPILGDDLYGDRAFNRSQKARTLRLCAVSLELDTSGRLPNLDHRRFSIPSPF